MCVDNELPFLERAVIALRLVSLAGSSRTVNSIVGGSQYGSDNVPAVLCFSCLAFR